MKICGHIIFLSMLVLVLAACLPAAAPSLLTSTPAALPPPSFPTPTAMPTLAVSPQATPPAPATEPSSPPPILGDRRVRQAIAYCTDRRGLIRSVYPWLADVGPLEADSFLPRDHWAHSSDDPGVMRYAFAPELGRALLGEAGWTLADGASYRINADGKELALTLTTTDAKSRRTWAAVWEDQMRACGIRIIRNHTPAAWFFGEDSGLARRDFEIAAFASVADEDFGDLKIDASYACDRIPSPANDWQGENYAGWCNEAVDAALDVMTASLQAEEQGAAYRIVQREYARDVPQLPLFYRVSLFAVDPALENFVPTDDGIHTWNAAAWRIPGRDTIVIGEDAEPAGLLWFEQAYVANVIRTLVTGSDVIRRDGRYQPVLLERLPILAAGGAVEVAVTVKEGDHVVDRSGQVVRLEPGVVVRRADGQEVVYAGGEPAMRQLAVTYEFVDGLRWSDGVAVSAADYELAYRAMCDPAIRDAGPFESAFGDPFPACDEIADVAFLSDNAYRVTWRPGFTGSQLSTQDRPYFLPPFGRLPAHQILEDGRRLADVPPEEWSGFEGVNYRPLGVGPYAIKEWVYGGSVTLEANPHYFQGRPATARIVVRFLEHGHVMQALLAGGVDVVDWETLGPDDVAEFGLLQAQEAGKVRVIVLPSSVWEHLDFGLLSRSE